MTDEERRKLLDEIHKEDEETLKKKEKVESRKAYSLLFLVISSLVLFGTIFSGEQVPIWLAIVIFVGDIWALHNFGIF